MKKLLSIKGFTLIELLVVITIIGILATGATTIYTSAQQKARDSIRQTDVLSIKSAIEQSYGDKGAYPKSTEIYSGLITAGYLASLPKDPKSGQADQETVFSYVYGSAMDINNKIGGQEYEISANYENSGNAKSKEGCTTSGEGNTTCTTAGETNHDAGNDGKRWEIGVNMANVNTDFDKGGETNSTNNWETADDTSGAAIAIDSVSAPAEAEAEEEPEEEV